MLASDISQVSSPDPHDVVIVGGGTAGLLLAHALSSNGLSILVLEAGGEKRTSESQDFYRGEITDPDVHPSIDRYRERAIGGTSRIWGGRLVPFDPIDFEKRHWVPESGWPIKFETLEPYYKRAVSEADGGQYAFCPATALPKSQRELVKGLDGALLTTTIERFSKPTNFWKRFGAPLRHSKNVKVVLNASVTAVQLTDNGNVVAGIRVAGRDGSAHSIVGRSYVLALGCLETTRLLLASSTDGIGNASGQLGRNYMSHLSATAGIVTFDGSPRNISYDYERDTDGIYLRRRLWINETAQQRLHLLNTTFQTHFPDPSDPNHGDAILSAMYLVRRLVLYEYSRKFSEGEVRCSAQARHLLNILRQPLRLARFGCNWLRDRTLADRKLPSLVLGSPQNRYVLQFVSEQSPNPASKLTLSSDRDAFGMPRLKVDWNPCERDFESIRRSYRLLSEELARTGTGKLEYDPDALADRTRRHGIVGGHHIGTTRMSDNPRQGVVDADCRVHGLENLFVISTSVFPTSSQANPTLTLLALALRLADRLQTRARPQ